MSLSFLLLYTLNIPISPLFHLHCCNSHLALHLQTQCSPLFPLFQPNFMPSCLLTKLSSCPWLFFLHIIFCIPKKYFPKAQILPCQTMLQMPFMAFRILENKNQECYLSAMSCYPSASTSCTFHTPSTVLLLPVLFFIFLSSFFLLSL